MENMVERAQQKELALRANGHVPFKDNKAVKGFVAAVVEASQLKDGSGEAVLDFQLSRSEKNEALKHLGKHHGSLRSRIGAIYPIRLEEGIGTVIEIRQKGRR